MLVDCFMDDFIVVCCNRDVSKLLFILYVIWMSFVYFEIDGVECGERFFGDFGVFVDFEVWVFMDNG